MTLININALYLLLNFKLTCSIKESLNNNGCREKSKTAEKTNRHTGLVNIANSCWFNSVIQLVKGTQLSAIVQGNFTSKQQYDYKSYIIVSYIFYFNFLLQKFLAQTHVSSLKN